MLPFEVDVALESEINAYKDREAQDEADEWTKQLYPVSDSQNATQLCSVTDGYFSCKAHAHLRATAAECV